MDSDTTLLLDLNGVAVESVERLADGTRRVHLITADDNARACPACGVFAVRVKGIVRSRPRDLPYGERRLELVWHKRRWYCTEATPSFPDMVVKLRRTIIAARYFDIPARQPGPEEIAAVTRAWAAAAAQPPPQRPPSATKSSDEVMKW